MTLEENEQFNEKLKASVVLRRFSVDNDCDNMPTDTAGQTKQLKQLEAYLGSHKQCLTYIKCLMGRNMQKIKESRDKKKGTDFVLYVQEFLPKSYKKTEIYFMIDLHKVAQEYNRLMYVTIPTSILKTNFKLVKKLLKDNADYWKAVA